MGGVINWVYLGQDSFLIKVFYFSDCNSIDPTDSLMLNIKCDATGTTLSSVNLPLTSTIDMTPICNTTYSRCGSISSSFPYGISKCTYQKIVKINNAGNCCFLRLSFESYPRTDDISTGGGSQIAYIEAKLNRCQSTGDHSPELLRNPITIIPAGQNYVFNFNAKDTDGDSLSYEITPPLTAHNSPVSYVYPYSYQKPVYFWDFPYTYGPFPKGFHLDSITGDLMFRPTRIEHTIMAVKVREFRNGNQIGEIMVEWPIIVIANLNANKLPSINTYTFSKEVCAGSQVIFDLPTTDSDTNDILTINWDNSIPDANWSVNTSNPKRPTATLTWTPDDSDIRNETYNFLVAVEDNSCPLKGTYYRSFKIKVKPPIAANISVIDTGCGKYQFTAQTIKGTIKSYNWYSKYYFNNNSSGFAYRFSKPGSYPYKLTINNPASCVITYYDTIVTDTFLYIEMPPDTHICSGNNILIKPKVYYGAMSMHYIWNNSIKDTIDHLWINPFNDTVINLKVIDALGCERTAMMKIYVNPLPIAEAGNDKAICLGEKITLTASGGNKYEWNTGDSNASIEIQPKSSGYYSVKVMSKFNCIANDSVYLTLNSFSTDAGNDTSICRGKSVKLKANGGIIFKWNNGLTSDEITVTPDSTSYFSVVATDLNNCAAKDSVLVNIKQNPVAFAGLDAEICKGQTATLQASGGIKYFWNTGDTNDVIIVNPALSQYYTVRVTGSNECFSIDTVLVKVNVLPLVEFNASPLFGNMPLSVQFDNLSTITEGNLTQFKWNFGDGATSTMFEPSHTFLTAGGYAVNLACISDKGCQDSLAKQNFISVITDLDNNIEQNGIRIIPNPAADQFEIITENHGNNISTIIIYNNSGSVIIKHQNINSCKKVINSTAFDNGLYIIEVIFKNGKSSFLKVMIEK
jgi:PKD repeat protein